MSQPSRAGVTTETPNPQGFRALGLNATLVQAAQSLGVETPTPVQQQAIPAVLAGRDVLAQAPTGSGKTLAYVLPGLQALMAQEAPPQARRVTRWLVVVPTRDLADQVSATAIEVLKPLRAHVRVVTLTGGTSVNRDQVTLRAGADMVVATPGRLLDLMKQRALSLDGLTCLVLDEADRLLETGFAAELSALMSQLPAARQTLLWSATFSPAVLALAATHQRDAQRIEIKAVDTDLPDIEQRAVAVDEGRRTALLKAWVGSEPWKRVLVFVATKYASIHVSDKLYRAGINATAFHGDMAQSTRQDVLREFKAAHWQVVVTTDLAARGIDVSQLDAVINFDLPRSTTDYVHRIGRTGRAGQQGVAISMVTAGQRAHWRLIARRHALDIELEEVPGFEPRDPEPERPLDPEGHGGIKGKRPSKKDKARAAQAASAQKGGPAGDGT